MWKSTFHSYRSAVWVILFAACTAGCASVDVDVDGSRRAARGASLIAGEPARQESIASLIAGLPVGNRALARRSIAEGASSSVFLVRIADREEPHRHTEYDMTVILVEGEGTLWLAGQAVRMVGGDIALVPRGVSHHFINSGEVPASAVVVFSPKFHGPDSEPAAP